MPDTPPVIHTHIERDRRKLWHGVIEIRRRGQIVYAMTFAKGHVQRQRAAAIAANEMIEIEKAGQRA